MLRHTVQSWQGGYQYALSIIEKTCSGFKQIPFAYVKMDKVHSFAAII